MMEQYLKLAVMLVVLTVGCHGQSDLPTVQLHSRVQELEKTMLQLLTKITEMQNSQIEVANKVIPGQAKRGYLYQGDGLTLNGPYTGEVGFHVSLVDDAQLSEGKKIHFDTVVENIGLAYDRGTAVFTCRVPGTYLFSLNIACQQGTYTEVSAEISNGTPVKRYILNTVCDHRKRTVLGGGSLYCGKTQNGGTAIVSLSQGEKVIVKVFKAKADVVNTILGQGLSTFSGYLLRTA